MPGTSEFPTELPTYIRRYQRTRAVPRGPRGCLHVARRRFIEACVAVFSSTVYAISKSR